MAGIASFENFLADLKQLYTTRRFCDVQLKLMEDGEIPKTKVIDVHAFVLEMNSTYFKGVLKDHQSGQIKVEVQLKSGELKFMETLMSGFYDKEVFTNLKVEELLSVLELAMMYTNDNFVKYIENLLCKMDINYDICQTTLAKVYTLEHKENCITKLAGNLKQSCTELLAKTLSPVEEKHKDGFLELQYGSLLYLLESDHVLSISENSLLYFITLWLENDLTRQTGSIIGSLLKSLRVKFLSLDYLAFTITKNHTMFNKWDGFRDWLCDSVALLGASAYLKNVINPNYDSQIMRNSPLGIHAWYQTCYNSNTPVRAIKWLIRMTPEKPGEVFGPTEETFIHDGINYLPVSVNITTMEGNVEKKQMGVSIKCSGHIAGVRFVVGIVPADRDYDTTKIFFSYEFASTFLKWTDVHTFSGDVHVLDYWTVDEEFIAHANEHGLYVCLLPITYVEFERLKTLRFVCKHQPKNSGYLPLYNNARCIGISCGRYPCSISEAIHLTRNMNYSC